MNDINNIKSKQFNFQRLQLSNNNNQFLTFIIKQICNPIIIKYLQNQNQMSLLRLTKQIFYRVSNAQGIVIEYNDLKNGKDLTQTIQKAYGPSGLGILFVNGIPDYPEARSATLPSIWQMGNLPSETLKKYERPEIFHSLGWSKGVQQYEGHYDDAKGSYYVNCCTDSPPLIPEHNKHLYTPDEIKMNVGNIWVKELPQLQKNVKFLSSLMIKTGVLLAQQIDNAAAKKVGGYQKNHLARIIRDGHGHIGRMLHYFPFTQRGMAEGDWCGWHNDHGALTSLTSAMYIDEHGKQVKVEHSNGGLFAKNRFAEMARIAIPSHMLAFQLGEVSQIISGGYLEATPHCVIRNSELAGRKISRDTFALFMEPNYLEPLQVPDSVKQSQITMKPAYNIPELKKRWKNGMHFKDFHHATIKHYS